MAIKTSVFIPGRVDPIDLDDYATIITAVAGFGGEQDTRSIPDMFSYDNPQTRKTELD